MNRIKNVLFVCMGNTARSPAAEYLAKGLKKRFKNELEDITFDSAGFFNAFGYAQPETINYLISKGIESSDFIPKIINKNLLENQDLILTMEYSHSRDIKNNYPNVKDIDEKTFTLKEFAGETRDIDIIDPYYTSRIVFDKVLKTIDDYVNKAIKKIIEINKSNSN